MSAIVTNAAKRVGLSHVSQQAQAYQPKDPHYEAYTDARGRQKQRKRPLPAGLSKRDRKILQSVRRRAHYLDKGFTICGFRFGWTFLIGLIPGLGDVVDFLLGYKLVIVKSKQADLPPTLVSKMIFNLVVATSLGVVPLVGDIMLATWKANSRNAALLEDFLIARSTAANSAAPGTTSDPVAMRRREEQQAQSIIDASKIDHRSGERVGPPPAYVEDDTASPPTEHTPLAAASGSHAHAAVGGQKKKWYGWGK